jgi:hypothetical protein
MWPRELTKHLIVERHALNESTLGSLLEPALAVTGKGHR